ncbi:hypothetical protein [Haloarchaeobius sp. TZWWS8]|uniref:hypothetical protein n=1 Tax=Haloarchaeobius sp. TZWWS8 TaxID=3446121 RepID=UPI003EC05B21
MEPLPPRPNRSPRSRRQVLRAVGTLSAAGLSGCLSDPFSRARDTTPTSSDDASPLSSPRPEGDAVPSALETSITVTDAFAVSHIRSYSSNGVTVRVVPDDVDFDSFDLSTMALLVAARQFPGGKIVAYGQSEGVLDATRAQDVTVAVDLSDAPVGEPLYYSVFALPAGKSFDALVPDEIEYVHETDPFVRHDDGRIRRVSTKELDAVGDDSGQNHRRSSVEGAYRLTFTGRTEGTEWSAEFFVFKAAYVQAVRRDHGRSRPEFVAYETNAGFATEIASILAGVARRNGFTTRRQQLEFVVDFVQHLPYVPDDVSKGFDDYTKYSLETLVECGGDCEDSSILLASVLQAPVFGYDTVLIQPPGHMAVGIYGPDDSPGYYWERDGRRYYYVETTGVGWAIGDLPMLYRGKPAIVHLV